MVATQYAASRVLVQTGRGLSATDTDWTTQWYLRATGGSDGSNSALGEQTLVQDFGIVKHQEADAFASVGLAPDIGRTFLVDDLVGVVVRLLKSDEAGAITVRGETYTAYWHGVIQQQTLQPDLADNLNAGGRATWLAVGIGCVLDAIHLGRGWLKVGASVVDPGYLPPFNEQPGGDRSDAASTVNGSSVYVHVIGDSGEANEWTAAQILALLIAGAATPSLAGSATVYGWTWAYSDADGCLEYIPDNLDLGGLTLLQAIDLLATTRRAITWTIAVSGATATIVVRSAATTSISYGGYTIPASTTTATLDAAGDAQLEGLTIEQDESSTYDVIELRGAQPWTGITLVYPDHLEAGWHPGSVADWNEFPGLPLYDNVWRRFILADDWDETGAGGGLNNTVTATVDGLTGGRSATVAADLVPGFHHCGERTLPCAENFSASGIGPRQAPIVVVFDGASTYEDMSLKWRVEIQSEPFAIVIDDGQNGTQLRDRMAVPGAKMYVTVGMREHRPLAVSWQQAATAWPRATPRVKLIEVPSAELWRVAASTVTGVDGDTVRGAVGTSLTTSGAEITVRDNTSRLLAFLALAKAWFSVPGYRVRWTRRGVLDTDSTYAPGTLLTSVTLGDRTYGTYALITRRSWVQVNRDGVDTWDTQYETQRVLPQLEVTL